MINIATGSDFEDEDSISGDIDESAFFAPAFYEPWFDMQNGYYTDEETGEQIPLREAWFAGGRGCVDGDTLIKTPTGEVPIRDFGGGEVYAFDGKRIGVAVALKPKRYEPIELYEVETESGRKVVCSLEHRFLTPFGWRQLQSLGIGRAIFVPEELDDRKLVIRDTLEGLTEPVRKLGRRECLTRRHIVRKIPKGLRLERIVGYRYVKTDCYWDMEVPCYNNYVANGIIHHNSTKSSFVAAAIILMLEQDWQNAEDSRYGRNGMGLGPKGDIPNPRWYRMITNAIVYRKVAATLADSVYNQFQQTMCDYMGEVISEHWKFKKSPLCIVNTETGQEIMFRGLDDPLKSKSIKPSKGYFKYLWLEELAEYDGMEEIRNVRQSILRGGKKFLSLYSYNPPETSSNWVNDEANRKVRGRKVYRSDYLSVPREWLGDDFFIEAELLKQQNYRAYRHEYLGEVTGNGGTIFQNFVERRIPDSEIATYDNLRYGVDFGFALDPAAFVILQYDKTRRRVIAIDEIYQTNLMNDELAELIKQKKHDYQFVTCDSAEPKSIAELQRYGVNCLAAVKGPDSVRAGIKFLQSMCSIECDRERTPNFYNEFSKYEYEKDRSGEFVSRYPDFMNHLIDACLTGDTIVYTARGHIRISELVGTSGELLAFNEETGSAEVVRFCNVRKTRTDARTLRVSVDRCGFVDCTDDHRILTDNGYVEAGLLKVGAMVRCVGGYSPVTSIVENEKREDVFDLEVPTLHNFFVNRGVCVHNCRYALENDMTQGGLF